MNDATKMAVQKAGTQAAQPGGMAPSRAYLIDRLAQSSQAIMALTKAIEHCDALAVVDTSPLVEALRKVRNEHEYVLIRLYPKDRTKGKS